MGWLAGYTDRKKVPIYKSATAGAGTNYLMRLECYVGTVSIEAGTWVVDGNTYHHRLVRYLNEKSAAALADWPVKVCIDTARLIRLGVTTATGNEVRWCDEAAPTTSIDFWVEDVGGNIWNTRDTIYWVEIPNLSASELAHEIYMYFDEELGAVASASDGAATFSLFDHFTAYDVTKWTDPQPAWATVAGSVLTVAAGVGAADRILESIGTFSGPLILEWFGAEDNTASSVNTDHDLGWGKPGDAERINLFTYNSAYYSLITRHEAAQTLSATLIPRSTNYKWHGLFWNSGNVGYSINRIWERRHTANIMGFDHAKKISIRAYNNAAGETRSHYVNVLLQRKYCTPEPEVYGDWALTMDGAGSVVFSACPEFPTSVKFTGTDGTTKLRYWLDREATGGNSAVFWIEMTADLDAANSYVYVYYGKAGEVDESDSTIFSFFSDFSADDVSDLLVGQYIVVDTASVKDIQRLGKFTAAKTGSITHIAVPVLGAGNVRVAVYDDDGAAGEPLTLLGESASTAVTATAGFQMIPLAAAVAVTAGLDYYLGFNTSANSTLRYKASAGITRYKAKAFAAFDSPWNNAGDTHSAVMLQGLAGYAVYAVDNITDDQALAPWITEYDGFAQDPFAEEGMWNCRMTKISDTEYWLVTSSSWHKQTGLSLMKSSDRTHWQFVKYIQLPLLSTGQLGAHWDGVVLEEGGVYYMICDGSVTWPAETDWAPPDLFIFYLTSTDMYNWSYGGTITITAATLPYSPAWAKFTTGEGTFFYIYYAEYGEGDIRSARCNQIVGAAYTQNAGNPLIVPGGDIGFIENPSVTYDGANYVMYFYDYDLATNTIHMHWALPDTEDPWEEGWTNQGPIQIDGVDSAINNTFPAWLRSTQYNGTVILEGAEYQLWLTGRENLGHNNPRSYDGISGYLTSNAMGGDWSTPTGVTRKALRQISAPPAATLRTALTTLNTTDLAIMARVKGTSTNAVAGIMWRAAADNSSYYACYFDPSTSTVYVKKTAWAAVTSAVCQFTDEGKKLLMAKWVYKDFDIRMDEHNLTVYINGIKALTVHDTSIEGAGFVKLFGYGECGIFTSVKARKYVDPEPTWGAAIEEAPPRAGGSTASRLAADGVI